MKSTLPRITIITPSYNQGEFLEECINSVLSQNYPNLEYIIMDGGSSDNSVEIIRKYQKYLSYWQSEPDGGQYAAINAGFSRSSGEIMAWINSDDKYHCDAFNKISSVFMQYPELEWVVGRPTVWDKTGHLLRVYRGMLPDYSRANHLKKEYLGIAIQQESAFWRRSLWEKTGSYIDSSLSYAGDLELWNRFYRNSRLCTLNDLIGGFRLHGNQKSLMNYNAYISEAEKIIDDEALFEIVNTNSSTYKSALSSDVSNGIQIEPRLCSKQCPDSIAGTYVDNTHPLLDIILLLYRRARLIIVRTLVECNQVKLVSTIYKLKNYNKHGHYLLMQSSIKKIVDFASALLLLIVLCVPMFIIALLIRWSSTGPVLYWSDRVGRNNKIFKMPKFRTMRIDTPAVATHLLDDPEDWLIPIGGFLRKSSMDELPQLFSILKGDMSFVGPRPALFNQYDLIGMRTDKGVHVLVPGLTGWAQINGRDELPIQVKVDFDAYYLQHQSLLFDLKILLMTFLKVIRSDGVTH